MLSKETLSSSKGSKLGEVKEKKIKKIDVIPDEEGICEYGLGFLYLHMNWGWEEQGDGWFAYNNFTVDPDGEGPSPIRSYNDGRKMIYNIF